MVIESLFSVVGVTASYDRHAFRYNAGWRLQEGEIIEDFRSIVKTHLEYFKRENGDFPRKIIYYRDGVSDSQFGAVMAVEKTAIMQACHDVGCEKIVKLTILIVQKRHHARFFPDEKSRISVDRNNNVPPGTVVDTIIIRPNESHYYLCSHQSIQGVARPTKYCLLLDQSEHNIDDLTELTFNVCIFHSLFCTFSFSILNLYVIIFSCVTFLRVAIVQFHIQRQLIMPI